ncbi:MAG: hypothetical protein GY725_06055 [bacterium]|nr:hypothetical protein [bacterium]
MMKQKWDRQSLEQLFSEQSARTKEAKTGSEDDRALRAYVESAALQVYFDAGSLTPVGGAEPDPEALERTLAGSLIVYDEQDQPRWTLRAQDRRKALRRLIAEDSVRATLESISRPTDSELQRTYESYLLGEALPLEQQDPENLGHVLQVVKWLTDLDLSDVPEIAAIERRIKLEELLAQFHHLADDFVGRADELTSLRDYVGVLPPSSILEGGRRLLQGLGMFVRRSPLLIHGPGGVGKSTLIARFILDHMELPEELRFPFAYLNFDRPHLRGWRPFTTLREVVDQFLVQYPRARPECESLLLELTRHARLEERGGESNPFGTDVNLYVSDFADVVTKHLDMGDHPYLLVLDTFEEIQHRVPEYIEELIGMMIAFSERIPTVRVVIAGRGRTANLPVEEMPLHDLPVEVAQRFVGSVLEKVDVVDQSLVEQIVMRVGSNPLSLKLAAHLVQSESIESLSSVATKKLFFLKLDDGQLQGRIYHRLIDHIHDKRVRKLAHPGLLTRFITAVLIKEVLAGPCKVKVKDLDDARILFRELQRETSLVGAAPHDDEALIVHPELRSVIAQHMRRDKPKQAAQIDRAAVAHFKQGTTRVDRLEELFHRLCLGHATSTMDRHWIDGAEDDLKKNWAEYAPKGKAYLATKLDPTEISSLPGYTPEDQKIWTSADIVAWERLALRKAESFAEFGKWKHLIRLLNERSDATHPKLRYYRARALYELEDYREARMVLASLEHHGFDNETDVFELAELSARIAERMNRRDEAVREFQVLYGTLKSVGSHREQLRIGLELLRLHRLTGTDESTNKALRREVVELLQDPRNRKVWAKDPGLLVVAGAEVGEYDPGGMKDVIRYAAQNRVPVERELMAEVMNGWNHDESMKGTGRLAESAGLSADAGVKDWLRLLNNKNSAIPRRVVTSLVQRYEMPKTVALAFSDMFAKLVR